MNKLELQLNAVEIIIKKQSEVTCCRNVMETLRRLQEENPDAQLYDWLRRICELHGKDYTIFLTGHEWNLER